MVSISRLASSLEFFCVDVMENKKWAWNSALGLGSFARAPSEDNKPCNCPCNYDHGGCSTGINQYPDCSCTGPPCIGTCTGRG